MKISSIRTDIKPGWYRTSAQLLLRLSLSHETIWEKIVPAKTRFKVREDDCSFGQYHTIRSYFSKDGWVSVEKL